MAVWMMASGPELHRQNVCLGPELSKVMACGPCFLLSHASMPLVSRVAEEDPCPHFLFAQGQDQGRLPEEKTQR